MFVPSDTKEEASLIEERIVETDDNKFFSKNLNDFKNCDSNQNVQ